MKDMWIGQVTCRKSYVSPLELERLLIFLFKGNYFIYSINHAKVNCSFSFLIVL